MSDYWPIPRLWPGETAVILGGGPSLTAAQVRHVAMCRFKGLCRVAAINDAFYLAWWADWLHACDAKWAHWHAPAVAAFPGIKTTLADEGKLPKEWGVRRLHNTGKEGFDPDPSCCRTGANGTYQTVHSFIHAGIGKMLLLGVDMRGEHWFGRHPAGGAPNYEKTMIPHFATLLPALEERGIEVLNCSPKSALTTFPMASLEAALPCR